MNAVENSPTPRTTPRWLLPVAALVVVAGLIVAIVFTGIYGYRWYDDAVNKQSEQSERDSALGGAQQVMLNILNVNLKDAQAYRKRLEGSLTGQARTQLLGSDGLTAITAQANANNAATLTAKLSRSALVGLDTNDHSAKALIFLDVTSARPNEASSSQTMGFQLDLTRDGGVWKASTVQPLDAVALDPDGAPPAAANPSGGAAAPAEGAAPASPAPEGASAAPAPSPSDQAPPATPAPPAEQAPPPATGGN